MMKTTLTYGKIEKIEEGDGYVVVSFSTGGRHRMMAPFFNLVGETIGVDSHGKVWKSEDRT